MSQDVYLSFQENNILVTQEKLHSSVSNNFTIEFWAKPIRPHGIDAQTRRGISDTKDKRFVIVPNYGAYENGDSSKAGIGISVGTNGVSVYEHTLNHLPATLVYKTNLTDWVHISVVYNSKLPLLYINGKFVKEGTRSTKKNVVPSAGIGGTHPFGSFVGDLKDIRIWSIVRTRSEIQRDMFREFSEDEPGLFGYWKLNEGAGEIVNDFSKNKKNYVIKGAIWNKSKKIEKEKNIINILFTYYLPSGGIETLNRQRFLALQKERVNCHFLYTKHGTGLQNKINTTIFITNNDKEIRDLITNGNYQVIVVCTDLRLMKKIRNFGYKGILIYENQGLGFSINYADQYLKKNAETINKYSDAILYPVTPHLIRAFNKYLPTKKKYCFHNCFNSNEFQYKEYPKMATPIIGWVGRLISNKNWRDFLLIGAKLIRENPSIQLWIFEDNTLSSQDERVAFQKSIDELKLRDNLTIYANQPHSKMAEYFSKIGDSGGFLCSTSKVEGFGYAVLEALVCKCPVLTTDSEGVRSFIKHNETGKFFAHGDIHDAVREGKDLMTNLKLRELIRQNGIQHIKTNYSPEVYAANFKKMLRDLQILNR